MTVERSAPGQAAADTDDLVTAYLDLLKRAVQGYLQLGAQTELAEYFVDDVPRYADGRWVVPLDCRPHTVLHRSQLDLLEQLAREADARNVPGDFMEAGIWRGGAVIFLLGLVRALRMKRRVVAADTFTGIPRNDHLVGDPVDDWSDRWEASLDEFRATVARYGLADERLTVIPGRLPRSIESVGADLNALALLRVDVDSYESTRGTLEALYPRLSPGGAVIIDDWHLPGCFTAVAEFRARHGVTEPLVTAAMNAYWIKSPSGS